MAYYKQSFQEAQGNTISMDDYRERRAALKKKHGEIIFDIQARFEKRKRILQGQIHAINKEMQNQIKAEMERFNAEKSELHKLIQ